MFGIVKTKKLRERSIDEIKNICKILFIDDKKFPVIDILKNSGWKNTKREKDIESLDQTEVQEAHIIFLDVQGVGKKLGFKEEGLGLLGALSDKYPNKKYIVYSAEEQGKLQALHPAFNKADKILRKDSDPYSFQSTVEEYAKEAFSLCECIERIKKQILKEFGHSLETEKICRNLEKLYTKGDCSTPNVSKVFNIQNAAAIAEIVQLFFSK
jgi:hypothetical protein